MELTRSHKWSIGLIVATIVTLSAVDIHFVANDVKGDTISALVYEASLRIGAVAFMFGVLGGHFFIPVRLPVSRLMTWIVIISVAAAVTALGWFIDNPPWWSAVALFSGIAVGGVIWPNEGKEGA